MNNKERYKAVFSQVHTNVKVELEVIGKMKNTYRVKKRLAVLVAAITLLLAFSVTAYAMNIFGLKDLMLNDSANDMYHTPMLNPGEEGYIDMDTPTPPPMQLISLQGYSDSTEYQAVAEWAEFLSGYDKDGAILKKIGNGPTGLDEKYNLYLVYSQEMADKLEEIIAKYKLSLHSTLTIMESPEAFYEQAGAGQFLSSAHISPSAYIYEDGTFHIDGMAIINNIPINYQMMNCVKGSFTDVLLNITDASQYTEWTYQTASGITVSLSLGPDKALVIADLGSSFLTVNILAGSQEGIATLTAADVEAFANTIDLAALK